MRNPLNFKKHLPHFLRNKQKKKFIIIESDDWGLERALTEDSIEWMKKKYTPEKLSRWSYDSLETEDDLNELFEVISRFKNKFESPPVITANFITHNVDYSNKDSLKFRSLSEGFNDHDNKIKEKYTEGIKNGYIFPQLHGYSHYNISESEKYFDTPEGKESFENKFFYAKTTTKGNLKFLDGEFSNVNSAKDFLKIATEEFKKYFGFYSATLIPPTFIFDRDYIEEVKKNKIEMIQSSNRLLTTDGKRYKFPYLQNRKGLFWSVRNARLDPHGSYNFDHEQCIDSIGKAFKYNLPAVIDFHRVNFAGRYDKEYRTNTLKELSLLMEKIHKNWPESEFIHSQKLNEILWQQKTK